MSRIKVVNVKDNEVWKVIGKSWTSRDWERALLGTFRRGPPGHRDTGRRMEKKNLYGRKSRHLAPKG